MGSSETPIAGRAAKVEEKQQRELAEAIASMMEGGESYYDALYRAAALRLRLDGLRGPRREG